MTFVRVGGVPHHMVVEGSGPVCVLSAGLAMSWFDWDPVVPLLAPYRTVVRFDRPGHGLSGPAAVPPSATGEAHRIAALLDALGLAGPATVVGHSIAGFHAEAFARLHPARTSGIVLVDSSVEEDARAPVAPAVRTAVAHGVGTALSAVGAPAALGPLTRRAVVRLSRTGGGDPAPPRSYAAATAPRACSRAPCWRTPTTARSPPNCSRCAGGSRFRTGSR